LRTIIKIDFADFWPGFEKESNYFFNLLSTRYDIKISDHPDFLIYSVFGQEYLKYDCIRIFYTGENKRPYFHECDYAFSFDYIDDKRNFRLPLYALYSDSSSLIQPKPDPDTILRSKTKFCNMVTSNPLGKKREHFFHKLSKYKRLDSGGKFLNNIGGPIADKLSFIRDYKFSITFENSFYPGYTTEKIVQAMTAHSLPIYWGNPLVQKDFNTKSFINCHDYRNFDEVVKKIMEIDNDDDLYREYLKQPYFTDNVPNEYTEKTRVIEQFDYIISNKDNITPVALKDRRNIEMLIAKIDDLANDIERLGQKRTEIVGPELSYIDKTIVMAKSELVHSMNQLQEALWQCQRKTKQPWPPVK
jgi:alpha(1,3/1,4) fucosyltransferase